MTILYPEVGWVEVARGDGQAEDGRLGEGEEVTAEHDETDRLDGGAGVVQQRPGLGGEVGNILGQNPHPVLSGSQRSLY